jgi:hypothetical protein
MAKRVKLGNDRWGDLSNKYLPANIKDQREVMAISLKEQKEVLKRKVIFDER